MAKQDETTAKTAKKGDTVLLVTCRAGNLPATVTAVGDDGRVDLKIDATGQQITSAPHDPKGLQGDSWHFEPAPSPAQRPATTK